MPTYEEYERMGFLLGCDKPIEYVRIVIAETDYVEREKTEIEDVKESCKWLEIVTYKEDVIIIDS